jgi:hypothetical protein
MFQAKALKPFYVVASSLGNGRVAWGGNCGSIFFLCPTLVTGPRRSLNIRPSDISVYETQTPAEIDQHFSGPMGASLE